MAEHIQIFLLPKAPPPRRVRKTTFDPLFLALRTVVHNVASYAASKTTKANGSQSSGKIFE